MSFPKFLKIASLARYELVKINETLSTKKVIFDSPDDLLTEILAENLGFRYSLVTPTDGAFGSLRPDGNWTGMVGMIQHQEADLIINHLSVTDERRQIVDFSFPYYVDRIVFATKSLERSSSATSFLKPFSFEVWLSLLVCAAILPLAYHVLFQKNHTIASTSPQAANHPTNIGKTVFKVTWGISQTLMRWSYVAVLLSFLTLPSLSGVQTIYELAVAVRDGRYECTATPGSYVSDALITSGGYLEIIGRNLKEDKGTLYVEEALQNYMSNKKRAYIAEETYLPKQSRNIFISKNGLFPSMFSIGIKKGFCCKSKLDSMISRIWVAGIYTKLLEDAQYKDMYKIDQKFSTDEGTYKPLEIGEFIGLFIFLVCGHSLALMLLVLELLFKKYLSYCIVR